MPRDAKADYATSILIINACYKAENWLRWISNACENLESASNSELPGDMRKLHIEKLAECTRGILDVDPSNNAASRDLCNAFADLHGLNPPQYKGRAFRCWHSLLIDQANVAVCAASKAVTDGGVLSDTKAGVLRACTIYWDALEFAFEGTNAERAALAKNSLSDKVAPKARRAPRAVRKVVEMLGKASIIDKRIRDLQGDDSGVTLTDILKAEGVKRQVFDTSPRFNEARQAWATLTHKRLIGKAARVAEFGDAFTMPDDDENDADYDIQD